MQGPAAPPTTVLAALRTPVLVDRATPAMMENARVTEALPPIPAQAGHLRPPMISATAWAMRVQADLATQGPADPPTTVPAALHTPVLVDHATLGRVVNGIVAQADPPILAQVDLRTLLLVLPVLFTIAQVTVRTPAQLGHATPGPVVPVIMVQVAMLPVARVFADRQ